ncbi:MAG: RNA polymerase sigma factor SigJ, partial [Pseudomonadota bacterium]
MNTALAQFETQRPRLFALAYRMLGSISEAEDVLQEAWIRRQRANDDNIESEVAFLTTIVTRLSIDTLRAAKSRRETYYGVWLPEPLPTGNIADPADQHLLQDNISTAFMLMLETLTPIERAVFLLREVLDYGYQEIADIVDKQVDNCRQIERRARNRLAGGEKRFELDEASCRKLFQQFMQACQTGDTDTLVSMLTQDAIMYSDGGGKVRAAPLPVEGAERIALVLTSLTQQLPEQIDIVWRELNGTPAFLIRLGGMVDNAVTVALDDQ